MPDGSSISLTGHCTNHVGYVGSYSVKVVKVDFKPGVSPNPIRLSYMGLFPVAVLTQGLVDASEIDTSTVRFGPGNALAK